MTTRLRTSPPVRFWPAAAWMAQNATGRPTEVMRQPRAWWPVTCAAERSVTALPMERYPRLRDGPVSTGIARLAHTRFHGVRPAGGC
jgi:hypothetical protein